MTVFSFPKSRHVRLQRPPTYRNYSSYRPFLQKEFYRICVYCRTPDSITASPNFGVDHYKPKSKFPLEENRYANLYYCCSACNSRKRDHWPKPDVASTQFVPNPCDHVMFDHLRFQGDTVNSKSEAGRFTTELLDLNDPKAVGFRAFVFRMIETLKTKRAEANALLMLISSSAAANQSDAAQLSRDRIDIAAKIVRIDEDIGRLEGTAPLA